MAGCFVVDMEHYTDVDWSLVGDPAPLRRVIAYLGSIVEAASASSYAGRHWQSALRCRRRPKRRACGGRFVVLRQDVPPRIEWQCPNCGESGIITGWWHTEWDLSRCRPDVKGGILCTLSADQHRAFFGEALLKDDLRALLRAGEWQEDDSVLLQAAKADWDVAVDHATVLAKRSKSPTRKRHLLRAVRRLEEAGSPR